MGKDPHGSMVGTPAMSGPGRASTPRSSPGVRYLLGHTDHELRRLGIQGDLYREVTLRGFREAGVGPGMRVLDIGCGTGDVSRVAAEIVGDSGSVLGIDRGPEAIRMAREISANVGVPNTSFVVSELEAYTSLGDFDALVGRFILMHQEDPAAALSCAAGHVRSGGSVCMIESYMNVLLTGAHSFPRSPLYDEIVRWKGQVVGGAGADLHAGGRLRNTFIAAGLPAPTTQMHARLEGGADSPYFEYIAQSVRSMLPEAARQGLGGFTESDADSLEQRLRSEVMTSDGVLVAWPVVVAHARVP